MTLAPEAVYSLDTAGFAVEGRIILPPLTATLGKGRIHALVGPNGSGKSSLIKLLARQQKPTGGAIALLGRDIGAYADREFARHVGYMPQFTPPAEGMIVRELVALGRFPWHGALGRFSPEDAAKVETALEQTGLMPLATRLVDTLSGGERQRAWLAMMIAQDTEVLLLDEPTSALDIAHQVEMLGLVRDLSRSRGLTVVIVLHDINMAARYCDEIIALVAGRIVARGAPDAVMSPAVLQDVYGLPMGVMPHPGVGLPMGFVL